MKRSAHVLLTGVFLASISSYRAKAQDVVHPNGQDNRTDTASQQTSRHHYSGGHVGFFGRLFGRHHAAHNNKQQGGSPAVAHTTGPRKSGGFGTTLRKTSTTSAAG